MLLRRRAIAALCAGVAVMIGVQAARPTAPSTEPVLVAAHDLRPGVVIAATDLREAAYADGTAPDGAVSATRAIGRTLAAPLRSGEPVTDLRLVGDGLLAGYTDPADPSGQTLVALPIRIPDAGTVDLLRVGDRVELFATDPQGGGTEQIAGDVAVLALPAPDATSGGPVGGGIGSGRLIVIGCTSDSAADVADAAVRAVVTIALVN